MSRVCLGDSYLSMNVTSRHPDVYPTICPNHLSLSLSIWKSHDSTQNFSQMAVLHTLSLRETLATLEGELIFVTCILRALLFPLSSLLTTTERYKIYNTAGPVLTYQSHTSSLLQLLRCTFCTVGMINPQLGDEIPCFSGRQLQKISYNF